jgi:hypothetical protein
MMPDWIRKEAYDEVAKAYSKLAEAAEGVIEVRKWVDEVARGKIEKYKTALLDRIDYMADALEGDDERHPLADHPCDDSDILDGMMGL